MTKKVYDPKEHQRANEALHQTDLEEKKPKAKAKKKLEKTERTPKINKYGFLHIDREFAKELGIEGNLGKDGKDTPVTLELLKGERGFIVRLKA